MALLLWLSLATIAASEVTECKTYDWGQEANITVDDTSGQCVFELQQEDKHCCFASRAEQEELCSNRNEASKGCREHTEMWSSKYSLELRRKQDDTILFLPNFQESDAGVYTITCSGSHVKKVELKGNSHIKNYMFPIDSSEKKISFPVNAQTNSSENCVVTVKTHSGICCYETGKVFCNGNREDCRVKSDDCKGQSGICRSYQVKMDKGNCILSMKNIDFCVIGCPEFCAIFITMLSLHMCDRIVT